MTMTKTAMARQLEKLKANAIEASNLEKYIIMPYRSSISKLPIALQDQDFKVLNGKRAYIYTSFTFGKNITVLMIQYEKSGSMNLNSFLYNSSNDKLIDITRLQLKSSVPVGGRYFISKTTKPSNNLQAFDCKELFKLLESESPKVREAEHLSTLNKIDNLFNYISNCFAAMKETKAGSKKIFSIVDARVELSKTKIAFFIADEHKLTIKKGSYEEHLLMSYLDERYYGKDVSEIKVNIKISWRK